MSIHVIVNFKALPASAAALAAMLGQAKDHLPAVPGCQGASLFRQADDEAAFTLVETWDSRESHAAHLDNVVASGAWASLAVHLACDPSSNYCKQL